MHKVINLQLGLKLTVVLIDESKLIDFTIIGIGVIY